MFTQCSECETVFRLSAEALRAAGGQVRCGRCGEVFNALSRLAEDSTGFTKGESPLELETRAEEILESVLYRIEDTGEHETTLAAPANDDEVLPPGVEGARLQFVGLAPDELNDNSLEFTLPPGDLDRVFVDTHADPAAPPAASSVPEASHPEAPHPEQLAARSPDESRIYELPPINVPQRRLPVALWVAAAILLAALLVAQVARSHLEWLTVHVPLLLSGRSAPPAAGLDSYQLRQWGVTGDPAAKGTLRVRASIMNTSAQLQVYPLLRVSLLNRFGSRVGTRDFDAAEYLGRSTARLLGPGERADVTLDILDPGKDAEGFEIDVCIRGADKAVACAADAASQTH